MTTQHKPTSSAQQLVSIPEFPAYFASKTGGAVSAETSKVHDGGRKKPETLSAPPTIENVVISRPYRNTIHAPILKRLRRQVGEFRTTISVWDTDPDLGPIGEPTVYADALLVRVTSPDLDAASSEAARFELEFSVDEEA